MFLINPYILQASGNPLWNDLLAYYTADNTPNDALGNYNGTLVNGATYGTGIINQGFSFDGVNDYVQLDASLSGFSNTQPHTYSAWINTSSGSEQWVINNCGSGSGTALVVWVDKVYFWFAGQNYYTNSISTITRNALQYICVTYDGFGNISFYINGSLDVVRTTAVTWTATGVNRSPRLGSKYNSTKFVNGVIDEVGIWDRELTASEVTELYNSGAGLQY